MGWNDIRGEEGISEMRPLSTLIYFKRCFSKVFPVVTTVALSVMALYFMAMFVSQLNETIREASVYGYKRASLIVSGKNGFSKQDMEKVKSISKDLGVYTVILGGVSHKSIIGTTSTDLLFSNKEEALEIFKHMGCKLLEGKLPDAPNDIVIQKKIAKAYGLKPGDKVIKGRENWYLEEDVTVTGIYSGNTVMGIGVTTGEKVLKGSPFTSFYICGTREQLNGIDQQLISEFAKVYRVYTYDNQIANLKRFSVPMSAMKLFLGVILVITIGVFLANITSVQYANRKKELQLLHAIGYTRKQIIMKSLKEISLASVSGYFVGLLLTIILALILNLLFLSEVGSSLPILLPVSMLTVGLVPISIILFGMLAPIQHTRFRDI